jgi:hypothetical protein
MPDTSNDKYLNISPAGNFLTTIAPHKNYDHSSELL